MLGEAYLGPWVAVLSEDEARSLRATHYRDRIDETGDRINPYLFGSADLELPLWAGYSLAYHMVIGYLEKNRHLPIEQLTAVESREFVGYL